MPRAGAGSPAAASSEACPKTYHLWYARAVWEILEHRRLGRRLQRLPVEVLRRYEKWKDIVRISGPPGLRQIKGFHDEALRGEWKGFRSSRLGQQYRVIYKIEGQEILIFVVDITAHDYRRR